MAIKATAFTLLLALSAVAVSDATIRGQRAFECPELYGNFPHSLYCNLYWQCRAGQAYLFECPYDWLFDSRLAICDLPNTVDCGNLIIPGTKPPTEPTTTSSKPPVSTEGPVLTTEEEIRTTETPTTTTTSTTPKPTTPGPFVCPAQDGSFPNPASCESYIQCVAGVAFIQNCAPGTWFNPTTGACEFPGSFCEPPRASEKQSNPRGNKVHELIRRGKFHPRIPQRQAKHQAVLAHRRVRT